jgi:C4-dicarboxylate transporter, DcuC family
VTLALLLVAGVAVAAVFLVRKGVDVRLVLIAAGLVMVSFAGTPWAVFDAFQATIGKGGIIGPICAAMGYAYVLRITGADREMVTALTRPLQKVKPLLVPGGVAIGFITNMAITSQTASAAALGPILIPVMLHAGYRPLTAAATLLIGCSVGGNLFNPGEPDIVAIQAAAHVHVSDIMLHTLAPNLIAVGAAMLMLCILSWREMFSKNTNERVEEIERTKIHWLKAIMPPLPVFILLLLQPGLNLIPSLFAIYPDGLHVSMVMLICSGLLMLIDVRSTKNSTTNVTVRLTEITTEFFNGMGFAFAKVISIILAAACFISGLEALGVIGALSNVFANDRALAVLLGPATTWIVAVIGGSGTAASVAFSQSIVPGLVETSTQLAIMVGVAGAVGANVGRTMSPVAAVVLFTSALADVPIADLVKTSAKCMLAALFLVMMYGLLS